jgi:hypothetical protein
MSEALYVAGGVYSDRNHADGKRFGLVHPSNDVPYVVRQDSVKTFWNVSKHHSHLYRIVFMPTGAIDVVLQTVSQECIDNVEAPARVRLSEETADKLRKIIEAEAFTNL